MRILQLVCSIVVLCALFTSCKKEFSHENATGGPPPLGNDCSIVTVTPYDSASGRGYGSFHITTGVNNLAHKTEWYDSTSGTVSYHADFTYSNDTMRVNKNEFFVLDGSGRVKEFHTLENPLDTSSERYKYTYAYDADGQLHSKQWFLPAYSPDVPFFTYKYDWINGNLVGLEVNEATGDKRLALSAELSYNDAKTVKNFLYFFPDAHELALYIFSVNMGKKSKNLLEKIAVKIYDADGNEIQAYNTEYKNYKFSSDDYVTELYASGDIVDGLPLVDGLTKFEYQCK
ncbi:hypothetical protein [Agriterribacter sp.]|uniref:hypothetical protein n=1 Tax=Agriterribacter sp. TaxID=2821509 RepID=UPI002BB24117|nr:hypothetical protein [Agriterribacter sp.]HRO44592.1 hypothetical protein [Agriterribacter sp.]HRQ16029.1 hypothetical protein [Agriterribacter sp.]